MNMYGISGYMDYILMVMITLTASGLLYTLSMSVIMSANFIIRTTLEDKTLKNASNI